MERIEQMSHFERWENNKFNQAFVRFLLWKWPRWLRRTAIILFPISVPVLLLGMGAYSFVWMTGIVVAMLRDGWG